MRSTALIFLLAVGCTEHGKGGGTPPPDGGGPGASCGGFAGDVCAADEWCDFGSNSCGATDEAGVCRKRPTSCDAIADPVCGCDGIIHNNECDAQVAGADVDASGRCRMPAGQFACGFRQCNITIEFCAVSGSDIGGEPSGFACTPLPGCGTPSCSCLQAQGVQCADILCSGDASTGITVTCPGG